MAFIRTIALAGSGLFLFACATQDFAYKLYPGPERPRSELAVVKMGNAWVASFDDRPVRASDWTEVLLSPGEHTVQWEDVVLEAGHVYTLKASSTFNGDRTFFWIQDDTTRQPIAGTPKP